MDGTAALRAEWRAQLVDAIESAQRVAWRLGGREATSLEARELYARLEEVRVELDSLRCVDAVNTVEIEPDWLRRLGWGRPRIDFE